MKATLRYRYVTLPQIKLRLKKRPIGTMARRYTRPVIFTVFRPSSRVVVRARSWVIKVANARCHVVRMIAKGTLELEAEHARNGRTYGNLGRENAIS